MHNMLPSFSYTTKLTTAAPLRQTKSVPRCMLDRYCVLEQCPILSTEHHTVDSAPLRSVHSKATGLPTTLHWQMTNAKASSNARHLVQGSGLYVRIAPFALSLQNDLRRPDSAASHGTHTRAHTIRPASSHSQTSLSTHTIRPASPHNQTSLFLPDKSIHDPTNVTRQRSVHCSSLSTVNSTYPTLRRLGTRRRSAAPSDSSLNKPI